MLARGEIYCAEAYAQGKMINHSAWLNEEPRLPRRITPSDIDSMGGCHAMFDNGGKIIHVEFSRGLQKWDQGSRGQLMAYKGLVNFSPHCSALCKHSVDTDRQICSRHDVKSFQVMVWDFGIVTTPIYQGSEWERFVFAWFRDASHVRRSIISQYGLRPA